MVETNKQATSQAVDGPGQGKRGSSQRKQSHLFCLENSSEVSPEVKLYAVAMEGIGETKNVYPLVPELSGQ